jgi:hypothetical protein
VERIEKFLNDIYSNMDDMSANEIEEMKEEMRIHLMDYIMEAKSRGLSEDLAIDEALEHFGSESDLRQEINEMTPQQVKNRMTSRKIKLTVSVLMIAIISFFVYTQFFAATQGPVTIVSGKENTYEITLPVNKDHISYMHEDLQKRTGNEKFSDADEIDANKTNIRLSFDLERVGKRQYKVNYAEGTLHLNEQSFEFEGHGLSFIEFVSPDTGKTYYSGTIEGEMEGIKLNPEDAEYYDGTNISWMVIFSPEDQRAYIQTGVSLDQYHGFLAFGKWFMNKEYWDAMRGDGNLQSEISFSEFYHEHIARMSFRNGAGVTYSTTDRELIDRLIEILQSTIYTEAENPGIAGSSRLILYGENNNEIAVITMSGGYLMVRDSYFKMENDLDQELKVFYKDFLKDENIINEQDNKSSANIRAFFFKCLKT